MVCAPEFNMCFVPINVPCSVTSVMVNDSNTTKSLWVCTSSDTMFYQNSPFGATTPMINSVGRTSTLISPMFTAVPTVHKPLAWFSPSGTVARIWYEVLLPFVFKFLFLPFANNEMAFVDSQYWKLPDQYHLGSKTKHIAATPMGVQGRSYTSMHIRQQDLHTPFSIVDVKGQLGFWIDCQKQLRVMDNNGTSLDCVLFRIGRYHARIDGKSLVLESAIENDLTIFGADGITRLFPGPVSFADRFRNTLQSWGFWTALLLARRIEKTHDSYMYWPKDTVLLDSPNENLRADDLVKALYPFVDENMLTWSTAFSLYDLFQDTVFNNRWAARILALYRPTHHRLERSGCVCCAVLNYNSRYTYQGEEKEEEGDVGSTRKSKILCRP